VGSLAIHRIRDWPRFKDSYGVDSLQTTRSPTLKRQVSSRQLIVRSRYLSSTT
jgi:hypothetical protein